MRLCCLVVWLLCCSAVQAQSFCPDGKNEEALYQALQQVREIGNADGVSVDRSSLYAAVFQQCQIAQQLTQLAGVDNVTLHKLFFDLNTISFFTLDNNHIAAMQQVLREQQLRGLYVVHLAQVLYERYLVARLFPQARAIRQEFYLPPLPEFNDVAYQGRGVLKISHQQLILTGDNSEHRMIIVAAPGCHFSQNFLAWADEQPELRQWLATNALFLLPPSLSNNLESVHAMQQQYPWLTLAIAYKADEWPQIGRWGTPSFYFHIADHWQSFSGWPKGGKAAKFFALQQQLPDSN